MESRGRSSTRGSLKRKKSSTMAAEVSTVPLQNAIIQVKNLRLQEDYEVEDEETQLFLVADSIQVTVSGAKKFVTSADDYDEVDEQVTDLCTAAALTQVLQQSASVIADESGQPFTVDTGMVIIKVPAGAIVSVDGQDVKVTEEVQIDIFEDEDDDADESKQRDIKVTRSTGADNLKGHVTLQLQDDVPEVRIQCESSASQISLTAAEPIIYEDSPDDEDQGAYSSENDDDQFYNEQLREKNRLTNLWTEKEKVFRAEMEQKRREDEEQRRFKSRAPLVSSIFSSNASIQMLVKLLLELSYKDGVTVSPVRDNIYEWNVKFDAEGFSPDSQIRKDLNMLHGRYGYSYIEMIFNFTPDLYPFLPPTVQVVRPRFTGFMMGRIVGAKLLQLERWDPLKGMDFVLLQMKRLLQEHGRLDFKNRMNNMIFFPNGAYSDFEYLLLKLNNMTDEQPRANLKYTMEDDLDGTEDCRPTSSMVGASTKQQDSPKDKDGKKPENYQAKGVGYGHEGNSSQFNHTDYLAAQRQRDAAMEIVLEKILSSVADFDYSYVGEDDGGADDADEAGQSFDILEDQGTDAGKMSVKELQVVMEESCLVPFLEHHLRDESIMDMMKRESMFQVMLSLIKEMGSHVETQFLVCTLAYQKTPLVELICTMVKQAELYLKATKGKGKQTKASPEVELAKLIVETQTVMNIALAASPPPEPRPKSSTPGAEAEAVRIGGVDDEWQELAQEYKTVMEPLRLDEADDEAFEGHHYKRPEENQSQAKVHRVAGEVISMGQSLPVEFQGMSIFVRSHEERMDWLKVMIMGPEGTPYEDGCFEFHVVLPPNYPTACPACNLETTGKGQFRFGPNLYHCGKVCLSLLGTWRGSAGENWNAETSSLTQLFISISAIVMTDDPYFNEPGCEREAGTPEGKARNQGYANIVRYGTVKHGMLEQLRTPSKGFEEVIQNHFRLKKEKVLRNIGKWAEESKHNTPAAEYTGHTQSHNQSLAAKFANGKYSQMVCQEIDELKEALDAL